MPEWKKIIFVHAVKIRIEKEEKTAAEIIETYAKLTQKERIELLNEFINT